MISGSNQQLQKELEYTLLKPDCHSWWISKMQSGREDTLEERYAIKFCFKLGKHATETYGMLQISTRTVHQFTTPSLSQTIWPRWASRQFVTVPIVQTLLSVTFGYSLSSEAVVMRQLRRWKRLWRRSLTCSHRGLRWGFVEVVGTVQPEHCSRRRLLWRGLEFHVCTINKSVHTKTSGNLFNDPRIWRLYNSLICVSVFVFQDNDRWDYIHM